MDEKQKILFCGDVEGKFNTLFNKIESINKKAGPFELLLCVGNFFGINNKEFEAYKSKHKKVVVPTYVLGPNKEEHVNLYPEEGSELCPNVHYLGKRGIYVNTNGIRIAYLSGVTETDKQKGKHTFNVNDVIALHDTCKKGRSNFKGVDILITSQWPEGIKKYDSQSKTVAPTNQHSSLVSWLDLQLKPRYHISGLEGEFYEKSPFRTLNIAEHDTSIEIVTRFLGLARVGNANKEKWIYALSLTPLDKMNVRDLLQKTTDEVPCPFNINELENKVFKKKRKNLESTQYFFDTSAPEEPTKKQKTVKKVEFDQSKCWFCLASPSVEKHLVIHVGTLAYLALAKGGLVDEHFLICPVEHHQSSITLSEAIMHEVQQYKSALVKFFAEKEKVPVFFERNYKTSHMQIQVIPIPKAAVRDLKEIFEDEANGHGFKLDKLDNCCELAQNIESRTPFFCVELPNGTALFTKIQKSTNFPINFSREVLASGPVLNVSERSDWKECILNKDDEVAIVKNLRIGFELFMS